MRSTFTSRQPKLGNNQISQQITINQTKTDKQAASLPPSKKTEKKLTYRYTIDVKIFVIFFDQVQQTRNN